ncbi:FAD-dependent monooxygenase [Streptomyces bacillaris]|uniref:FAD-dependent monooxygenase n=1 Tax=Streptomyces bacillaris TaxID=68179 RepID=UPI0036F5E8A7
MVDNRSGDQYTVHAQYLLGADGGRTVAAQIGVGYNGLGVITQTATLHVTADFSAYAKDPEVLTRWIVSPHSGAGVVMVPASGGSSRCTRRRWCRLAAAPLRTCGPDYRLRVTERLTLMSQGLRLHLERRTVTAGAGCRDGRRRGAVRAAPSGARGG